jgi:hypothetical protein
MTKAILPISARQLVRFPLPGNDDDEAPVFLLKPAKLTGKPDFYLRLAEAGARNPREDEYRRVLKEACADLLVPEEIEAAQADVDAYFDAKSEERIGEVFDAFDKIERLVGMAFSPYRLLLDRRDHAGQVSPLVAAKMLVKGWENVPVTFQAKDGFVTDECLAELGEHNQDWLDAVGKHALTLIFLPASARKNS